jgi:hypothetical protein
MTRPAPVSQDADDRFHLAPGAPAPSPADMKKKLAAIGGSAVAISGSIVRTSTTVLRAYRWTHEVAYGPRGGGAAGGSRSNGPADPVGGYLVDQRRNQARRALVWYVERLDNIARQLDNIAGQLRGLENGVNKRVYGKLSDKSTGGLKVEGDGHREPDPTGRDEDALISPAEEAAAKAAQRRREQRGEGWGEG